MPKIDLDTIQEKEIVPGYHAKMVHSDNMTLAYWRIEAGSALPQHSHVHEQVTNLLEGEFELVVAGETMALTPGKVVVIGSNVPHSGKAITDCRILDVFQPVREDYRE
jgi:quercetin dioxygenase-like cupin family protein